jgi:hypothetical protein
VPLKCLENKSIKLRDRAYEAASVCGAQMVRNDEAEALVERPLGGKPNSTAAAQFQRRIVPDRQPNMTISPA